jgi:hypothetical protein
VRGEKGDEAEERKGEPRASRDSDCTMGFLDACAI